MTRAFADDERICTLAVIQPLGLRYYATGGGKTATSGWGTSKEGFAARLDLTIQDCRRAQGLGGSCLIKLSDLWGADGSQTSDLKYPGDSNDWSSWDAFIQAVIDGLATASLAAQNTSIQIWNEPDTKSYWPGEAATFYEAFSRASDTLHQSKLGTAVKLWGPSIDSAPDSSNVWLSGFFDFLKDKGASHMPDVWDWHIKRDTNNDPLLNFQNFQDAIKQRLPSVAAYEAGNSEYGTSAQQGPGYSAYYLSRYSQAKIHGIRSNYASGASYHDYLTELLSPPAFPGDAYSETGEYWTYKTYADISSGSSRRCNSTTAPDGVLASYATCNGTGGAVFIGGPRVFNGDIDVKLSKVTSCLQGLQAGQQVSTLYWRLWGNKGSAIIGPVLIEGRSTAPDQDGSLTVPVQINDASEATYVTFAASS